MVSHMIVPYSFASWNMKSLMALFGQRSTLLTQVLLCKPRKPSLDLVMHKQSKLLPQNETQGM